MEDGLKIKVGVDLSDLPKATKAVEKEFADLGKTIEKIDGKGLDVVNKQLAQTSAAMKQIQTAGKGGFDDFGQKMASIKKPVGDATFAMTNFGRVLQDAPWGFIGISNNLNPLLESFQRLNKETGSTGATFKAMGRSLMGPGGIGIALSAFTAVMSFASIGFGAWTRGFKKTGEEAKSLADTIKELVKPINELNLSASGGAQGEVARVGALVGVLTRATESREKQKRALEELRKVNKEYFGDLTLEASSLAKLGALQQEYTQALVTNAIIKNLESEIGKVGSEYFKMLEAVQKLSKGEQDLRRSIIDRTTEQRKADAAKGYDTFIISDETDDLNRMTKELREQQKVLKPLEDQYFNLQNRIKQMVEQSLNFKGLSADGVKKSVEKIKVIIRHGLTDVEIPVRLLDKTKYDLREIRYGIKKATEAKSLGGFKIFDGNQISEEAGKAYVAFRKYWEEQAKKAPLYLEAPRITMKGVGGYEQYFTDSQKYLIEQMKGLSVPTNVLVGWVDKFDGNIANAVDKVKELQNAAQVAANTVGFELAGAFEHVFRTIATDGKISIQQLGDVIKQLIISLTSAAIRAAVLAAIMNMVGKGTGGGFGKIFTGLLGGGGFGAGMATGGIVPPGYPNDTFPARLTSNEAVIPLDRIDSIIGGGGGQTLTARVSGNDLLFLLEKTGRSQRRLGGV